MSLVWQEKQVTSTVKVRSTDKQKTRLAETPKDIFSSPQYSHPLQCQVNPGSSPTLISTALFLGLAFCGVQLTGYLEPGEVLC